MRLEKYKIIVYTGSQLFTRQTKFVDKMTQNFSTYIYFDNSTEISNHHMICLPFQVRVAGYDVTSSLSEAFQELGYCPQHDALWEMITLREHLHCFATLMGVPLENIEKIAN